MKFGTWRYLGLAGIVSASYFLAAELGLSLASAHTNVSPVWPPTGIAIAALIIFGRRLWPAILVGAFLANLWTGVSVPVALGIAAGNTLEAVAASHLLTYRSHFDSLSSIRNVLKFVLIAVIFSPIISSTIGNISLCIGGEAALGRLWQTLADMVVGRRFWRIDRGAVPPCLAVELEAKHDFNCSHRSRGFVNCFVSRVPRRFRWLDTRR